MSLICAEQFSLTYSGQSRPSLHNINLNVCAGECVLITGHSACGKSSLLRALCGITPYIHAAELSGRLQVAGYTPAATPIHTLGQRIGMIYQNPRMQFFCQTVREEMAFARENAADDPEHIRRDIDHYSAALGITALLERNLWQLSSGERQRVAIASALVDKTPILLFDEPTANLDADGIAHLRTLLPTLKARGITLIIAEHRLAWLHGIADRVITLAQGEMINDQTATSFWVQHPETLTPEPPLPPMANTEASDLYYHAAPNLPLHCRKGTITALMGANGSGKTTLLRTLAGLIKTPYPVFLYGKALNANMRRRHSFLVMQDIPRQLFAASVREEITLPQTHLHADECDRLRHYLDIFSLTDHQDQHPQALSGGEQQRVLLAAALFAKRDICLLDEPTSGLDAASAARLCTELRKLATAGSIVIVATHDPTLITHADYVYQLARRDTSR